MIQTYIGAQIIMLHNMYDNCYSEIIKIVFIETSDITEIIATLVLFYLQLIIKSVIVTPIVILMENVYMKQQAQSVDVKMALLVMDFTCVKVCTCLFIRMFILYMCLLNEYMCILIYVHIHVLVCTHKFMYTRTHVYSCPHVYSVPHLDILGLVKTLIFL